jgi:hypothetical protein
MESNSRASSSRRSSLGVNGASVEEGTLMNPKGCEKEVWIIEIERSWREDNDILPVSRERAC